MLDAHMLAQIVLVALWGALIGLDRTAVGQFMVSQPIVAAPVTGWVLGDPAAGLVIGAILEPIWVLDMPIGTFVPADSTIAAVSATAIAALGSGGTPAGPDLIGFSILLTAAMAPVTMVTDTYIRKWNGGLVGWTESAPDERLEARLTVTQGAGDLVFFTKFLVLGLLIVPLGLLAVKGYAVLPRPFHTAMELYVKLLPFLGGALIVRRLSTEVVDRYVLFGFSAALVATLLFRFHPALAVLCTLVAGWLGVRYRER